METARQTVLDQAGIPPLVQHNQYPQRHGVLRGLHYQLVQTQGKLVRCSRGAVFDVAVDVRRGSPASASGSGAVLDDVTHQQLWVPPGFAHGFLVLRSWRISATSARIITILRQNRGSLERPCRGHPMARAAARGGDPALG